MEDIVDNITWFLGRRAIRAVFGIEQPTISANELISLADALQLLNIVVNQPIRQERTQNIFIPVEITSAGECSICTTEWSESDSKVVRIPCKHLFHEECIKHWLETKKHENPIAPLTCPLCRATFTT